MRASNWGLALAFSILAGCSSTGDDTAEAAPGAGGEGGADAKAEVAAGGKGGSAGSDASAEAAPEAGDDAQAGDEEAAAASDASDAASSDTGDAGPDAPAEAAPFDGGPAAACFQNAFLNHPTDGPNYDQFQPTVGSHCVGTNHQDIKGVERVVFLGDSITVGTPPSLPTDVYRAKLAAALAAKFNIAAPDLLWDTADVINGTSLTRESGAFASCAKWGARTDDLLQDNTQVVDCFPLAERNKHHLVVITDGGNDIAAITKDGLNGKPIADIWLEVQSFVDLMRAAVVWMKDPANVPGGVDVIFGNNYEFTDGTGDTASCPGAAAAGFSGQWADPQALKDMVIWANEQYMKIAVDTKSDMIFMLESFCGHGYHAGDPAAPCYRGPGTPVWFDLTCIHPNPVGHTQVSDIFMAVVNE